ncbi:hypothetical protein EBR66_04365 [bacterium]|nr:hypothetical protein [bacterium]
MLSASQWETLLFFSSIFFTLSCVALVFGVGASVLLLDYHPALYAFGVFLFASACVIVTGVRTEA